jgi:hypothetical protein
MANYSAKWIVTRDDVTLLDLIYSLREASSP